MVHERYVLRIRHSEAQLAAVAPLLCAGITTWSPAAPLESGVGQVGVVGIGGLGHMGIKLAYAWCIRGRVHHIRIQTRGSRYWARMRR
ncbi:MAG: hypothetical protein P0107_03845 [Nitrosomonas sp.]|nr:hypothetical protein [Nitrosomonas sp.]